MNTSLQSYVDSYKAECRELGRQDLLALFAERVRNGAQWYDAHVPGWASRIDTNNLVVYSPKNGVDAQLDVYPPDLVDYGCRPLSGVDTISIYTERDWLGIFWQEEIAKRV